MSYLAHIRACNNAVLGRFVPLLVDEQRVGWLRPEFVAKLSNWPEVFEIAAESVSVLQELDDFESRTNAMHSPLRALATIGVIDGWR